MQRWPRWTIFNLEVTSQSAAVNERSTSSFLDRTLKNLRATWREIAGSLSGPAGGELRPGLPDEDADKLRAQMRECLEARGGEVSARARAAALGRAYLELNDTGRNRFLHILAKDFATDGAAVDAAVEKLREAGDGDGRAAAERALSAVLEAPRIRLLTQFNALPEGIKFLVDMRADLLAVAKKDGALPGLEEDLKGLLASWFDIGFLELRHITWDAPATLLEKLIDYEAVHAIRSWDDLKHRLDSDRSCVAYFHPRMPDEPLIFLGVALVNGMADNIRTLLDETAPAQDPKAADTAIFYSISSAQKGLAGISFGNFLIKRVVDILADEFKGLKTFATLSPAPGFRAWLDAAIEDGADGLLTATEISALERLAVDGNRAQKLAALLATPGWHEDAAMAAAARGALMRLCAHYLVKEKRDDGRALDPVAHFHFSNGARIERLNWIADSSAKGLEQSAGIMINYLYDLNKIEDSHEAYSEAGEVTLAPAVKSLLKG